MDALIGVTARSLADTAIEKDKVMWAAETERFVPKWPAGNGFKSFDAAISRLKTDMPDRLPV